MNTHDHRHYYDRVFMDYLKSALGLKAAQGGQVLGNGNNSSRPPTAASSSAAAASYDVTFGQEDAQLGMTVAFNEAGLPVVESLVLGGSASRKGVQEGDFVIGVDGNPVASYESLEVALCAMERPVVFTFRRAVAMTAQAQVTTSPTRQRSSGSAADEQRRQAMLAAAEERSKAYDRKMGKGGSSVGRGSKKSGEGLDKFKTNDDEATRAHVARIKEFEAAQAAALGYNPYESQSMSRAQAQARIELAAPAPSLGAGRMPMGLPPSSSFSSSSSPLAGSLPDPSSSSSSTTMSSTAFSSPSFLTPDAASGPYIPPLSQEEYESLEAFKANEETDMALAAMLDQPLERWRAAVSTILKILFNLLADPFQEKFRRLRLQNPVFQAKVSAIPGALDLLHAGGFGYVSEGAETFLSLPSPAPEVPLQTRVLYLRLKQVLSDTQDPSLLLPGQGR